MHNVLLLCPDEKDATSFYRGWGPFGDLACTSETPLLLHRASTNHFASAQVAWSTLIDKSLLFLQRACQSQHLDVLKIAVQHRKRTWCDWDDLLWGIPNGNPAKYAYGKPEEVCQQIIKCAALADVVTVSTQYFKCQFPEQLHEKIHVLRNRLLPLYRNGVAHQKPEKLLKVCWRGSRTHDMDWIDYIDSAVAYARTHDIEWHIIGTAPQWVLERLSDTAIVKLYNEIPLSRYFEWLILEAPRFDVLFVPLRDLPFNRAKSNIAMLEATFAGMLTVAPDWAEWHTGLDGVDRFLYASPDDVQACLERAEEQARQGAYALLHALQAQFRAEFAVNDDLFRDLVFGEEEAQNV